MQKNGFMTNFSKENAKSFDGLRHDSGNEEEITDLFDAVDRSNI